MSAKSKSERSELPTTKSSQLDRDVTFVESIEQDCICPICTYVADDPRSCGHCASLFCRTCLEEVLRLGPACPTCRSAVTGGGTRNIFAWNIIQGHRVYCCNYEACDWAGKYEELERHLNLCGFEKVKCGNKECNKMVPRQELDSHLMACPHRLVTCPACHRELVSRTLNTHMETCGKVAVRCRCDQELLREVQEQHWAESCPLTVLLCPFHLHGCGALVVRRDLDQHCEVWAPSHLQLISDKVLSLESDKLQLSGKVQSLEYDKRQILSKVQSLESDKTLLSSQVQLLESDKLQLLGKVQTMESKVQSLESTINDLSKTLTARILLLEGRSEGMIWRSC